MRRSFDGLDSTFAALVEFAKRPIPGDCFGFQDVLVDLTVSYMEGIFKSYECVTNKVGDILSAYQVASNELDAVRKDLIIKEEQLRSCVRCSALEKDLVTSRKRLSINEARIRSIAQILTNRFPATQDVDGSSGNESSVTKAYNLVSQMLMCDMKSVEQNTESHKEISEETGNNVDENRMKDKGQVTPKKTCASKCKFTSPVLGKNRHGNGIYSDTVVKHDQEEEIHENDYDDDTICIPPSPAGNINSKNTFLSTSDALVLDKKSPKKIGGEKRKAGVWELKTLNRIDSDNCSLPKHGKRLKQAQLSLKRSVEITDVSSLSQFNGGIRPSQASTQKIKQTVNLKSDASEDFRIPNREPSSKIQSSCNAEERKDDDIIVDSPPSSRSSSSRIQNRSLKKLTSSPKFKYRQGTVRKKDERMKLEGWDCENCRKYFEVASGSSKDGQQHKEHMNRCSRHRDKYPVHPETPPGFWNAEFPNTMECNMLNETYADILPSKKDDPKSLKRQP